MLHASRESAVQVSSILATCERNTRSKHGMRRTSFQVAQQTEAIIEADASTQVHTNHHR